MKSIYNSIKENIRQHPKISSSVLGNVDTWKRSHYIILADIIKEDLAVSKELQGERKFELGNTISHITLQRFFESDYQDKTHNDLRFLKTLDKICIFLGFKDLNSYIFDFKNSKAKKTFLPGAEFSTNIIYKYCEAEFETIKKLPVKDISALLDYVHQDSPLIERISEFMAVHSTKKMHLITKNNRSNFEVFDVSYISDAEENKVLKTQEFWNLMFESEIEKKEYFVNRLNTQIYFIKRINGEWKIWDNYNPNAGELDYGKE